MVARIQEIPEAELHFDPANPRLPKRVDGASAESVLDWMLLDAGLVELMNSIAENGFFPAEPMLVSPNHEGDGYLVLEGNRRLAAVKLLREPSSAPRRKKAVADAASMLTDPNELATLPCVVFSSRNDVLDYLGFRHVTGVKQWEPAAKARYLQSLYEEHLSEAGSEVYRVLARIIGSRSDYVTRLLGALSLHDLIVNDAALQRQGVTEENVSFSLLTLALNYTDIVQYLRLPSLAHEDFEELDEVRLKRLAKYLYVRDPDTSRTQLGESRNMRLLATALAHPRGRKSLRSGAVVEQAVEETFDMDRVVVVSVKHAVERLERVRESIPKAVVTSAVMTSLEAVETLAGEIVLIARRKQRRDARADV